MANLTSASSKSLSTLPSPAPSKHDGHVDGHLNCVGIRHGWTRTFSIPLEELETLDYAHLESFLELSTLKIRNLHLRIFVEHPPNSGTFSKVRFWKDDGSLQSVLVKDFFLNRRAAGEVTKFEVRDGVDRSDAESLRTIGSRVVPLALQRSVSQRGWFGSSNRTAATDPFTDDAEEAHATNDSKPSLLSLIVSPRPAYPQVNRRRSIFDFFRSAPKPPPPPAKTETELEEEELRKRGWLPPGMRRKKGLKMQLRESGNPFFGSQRRVAKPDPETTEGEPEAEDEFVEVDGGDSTALENRKPKAWARFRGNDKKPKQKGKAVEFVRNAAEAFPNGPASSGPPTPPKNASDID